MGKGLGALLGTPEQIETALAERPAPPGDGKAEIRLNPSAIQPNPFQPRTIFDPVKLAELAESIRTHGVLQPLIVRRQGDGYQLVSGERRWRASQQAGLTEVPVILRELSDREMLEIALVENVQREDISPLEAAAAYKRLSEEFSLTQEDVARRVGKSRSAVANTMRLLNLSSEIQGSLADGKITEGHARALLSIPDETTRLRTWRSLLSSGGSVREAETAARRSKGKTVSATPEPPRKDPHLQDVESRLRHALGTKVSITPGPGGQGTVTIEYYDDDDLNRLLDALGG